MLKVLEISHQSFLSYMTWTGVTELISRPDEEEAAFTDETLTFML